MRWGVAVFVTEIRPVSLAVQSALQFGPVPHRLIRIRVRFPDIGAPVLEQVGLLRFPGWRKERSAKRSDERQPGNVTR